DVSSNGTRGSPDRSIILFPLDSKEITKGPQEPTVSRSSPTGRAGRLQPNRFSRESAARFELVCRGVVSGLQGVGEARDDLTPRPGIRSVRLEFGLSSGRSDSSGVWGELAPMSIDKSLKKAGGLTRARNVLTRAERLAVLQEDERWSPEKGVFNLPKTKYRRLAPGQSGPNRPVEQD